MLNFGKTPLAVTQRYIEGTSGDPVVLLYMQHILPDTAEFVRIAVAGGVQFSKIVAKPKSVDEATFAKLIAMGMVPVREEYSVLEGTNLIDEMLISGVDFARRAGGRLVCVDVGGYFGAPLLRASADTLSGVAGVVEVTTFGHNRYKDCVANLGCPVYSVARSPLKASEALLVGDSAVIAADAVLRKCGLSLVGRRVGVIGFGMIGSRVARALRRKGLTVSVFDVDPIRQVDARLNGYDVQSLGEILRGCEMIFSATAERSVSLSDLRTARDGITLISVGSKGNEFDVEGLRRAATGSVQHSDMVTEFVLQWGKRVRVLRDGFAINFIIQSCPDDVMDLIHAEVWQCVVKLLRNTGTPQAINELPESDRRKIAAAWMANLRQEAESSAGHRVVA